MNRRSFFSFLGLGAAAAVVAPKVFADARNTDRLWDMLPDEVKWSPNRGLIGAIRFFEQPCEGYDYSIGVYAGDGVKGYTPSCVSVMCKGNGDEHDVQVAEFIADEISYGQLASVVAYIAKMYGAKCKDSRGPLIVIEQVTAPGDCCQNQLKIMGFTRFHRIMMKYSVGKSPTLREGWYSSKYSIPIVIHRFQYAVEDGWYKPNSPDLKLRLGKNEKELRYDPIFMAAAQSHCAIHDSEICERVTDILNKRLL